MRILLDTHILIWHLEDDARLSSDHGQLIEDPGNSILVSVASFWEMAIKFSRGKLSLSTSLGEIVRTVENSTSSVLTIDPTHTIQVSQLPFLHNDPFDRMIIAQAIVERVPLITNDVAFEAYGVELL